MRVVGRHHFDADVAREGHERAQYPSLLFQPVVLQFDVKIPLFEHTFQAQSVRFGAFVIVFEQM